MLLRAFLVVGALGVLALPTYGQQVSDTVAALQALQEGLQSGQITPDELRQRIEAAGLSMDDVREKLRQAGYPSGLLDQYLAGGVSGTGAAGFSSAQLEDVLRRLSIRPLDAQQISDSLRQDMQAFENLLSDTLAAARPRL